MHRRRRKRPSLGLKRVAPLMLLLSSGLAAGGSVEIITSPNHANVPLDRPLVRALFSMRVRQWPDGVDARVFVLPDNDPVHVRFCREQLGTFPYVLRSSWDRLVYTGTGIGPRVVSSEREMREKVEVTDGAIGYVSTPGGTGILDRVLPPAILALGDMR